MAGGKTNSVQPFLIDEREQFHVSELAADTAGAMSPFGDDLTFPLPLSKISYRHPAPEDRPRLAGE